MLLALAGVNLPGSGFDTPGNRHPGTHRQLSGVLLHNLGVDPANFKLEHVEAQSMQALGSYVSLFKRKADAAKDRQRVLVRFAQWKVLQQGLPPPLRPR
jgi:hypothetical protein